jgi:Right handed beta helix region
LLLIVLCLLLTLSLSALNAYRSNGRTPGELISYAEREWGHEYWGVLTQPVLDILRILLDEPALAKVHQIPFYVPPPPPLDMQEDSPRLANDNRGALNRHGNIIHVGPAQKITTIAAAAKIAADGDIIEIDSGEYRGDVSSWGQKKLTIRGIHGHARLYADGQSAEGKAIWVVRGGAFDIENIDFIGARVHDVNGAGIRFEQGELHIRHCLFYDNESGIISTPGDSSLEIENSEFAYNGHGDGQSHHIYVGAIASFKLTGSYLHHVNVGHLLKSRAQKNQIANNRITDESGGRASYELDFPNGGVVELVGNIIEQNRRTENSTIIAFGEEGYSWPENRLYMVNNTIVNDNPYGGAFLRVAAGAEFVASSNNLLLGPGRIHVEDLLIGNHDMVADYDFFTDPRRYDYRLNDKGRNQVLLPSSQGDQTDGGDLILKSQYIHPMQVKDLETEAHYAGALQ